jgi:hypothetical protein
MRANRPTPRSFNDVRESAVHFSVKLKCGIWVALTVPVKRSIILGGRFVVELRLVSEHWEASRDCVCALPPME